MEDLNLQLLACFQEHIRIHYGIYCERHHIDKSDQHFLLFLISSNIISQANIKRFTIQQEYKRPQLQFQQKSKAVRSLAERFHIGERSVWLFLKDAVIKTEKQSTQLNRMALKNSGYGEGTVKKTAFPNGLRAYQLNRVRSMTELTVLIFTPLQLEYNAVRRFLTEIEAPLYQGKSGYEIGRFSGRHHRYSVVLCQPGMYNTDMALATERAIAQFRPHLAILVGIAGGMKDVKFADVVIADKIYSYESGKEDGDGEFKARPEVGLVSEQLLARCQHIERQGTWKQHSQQSAINAHVVIGPIASGDKVVASVNNPTFQRIKTHLNDTKALEMEAYGFATALAPHRQVHGLVIRGISDLCEGKAHNAQQNRQTVAADHAAAVAFTLLESLDATEFITYTAGDVKTLVKDIYDTLFPAALKEISNDFADAANEDIRVLWKRVKPCFIEEVKELSEDPMDEDAQAVIRAKLKKAIEANAGLRGELEALVTAVRAKQEAAVISIVHSKNVVVGSTIRVGGDFRVGDG